jgi:haloalkane dehalogenase
MNVLRTPDARFENLPDWPYAPNYVTVHAPDGTALRLHYVDEGPRDVAPILLMHGNPSWSYLHRHMISGLIGRGHRVLAVDLMGMGRSDKPAEKSEYTLARHVDWIGQFLVALDLQNITLYCQDWGGIIGLCAVADHGDRFARIIASNTGIPEGGGVNKFMQAWLDHSQSVDALDVSGLVGGLTSRPLTDDEAAAYDAPFPDGTYQASPKQFPLLIPLQADNPGVPQAKATWAFLESWHKPFLTVFGSLDPISTRPGSHLQLQRRVPGAAGLDHVMIEGANHFIQEDAHVQLVDIIDQFARS